MYLKEPKATLAIPRGLPSIQDEVHSQLCGSHLHSPQYRWGKGGSFPENIVGSRCFHADESPWHFRWCLDWSIIPRHTSQTEPWASPSDQGSLDSLLSGPRFCWKEVVQRTSAGLWTFLFAALPLMFSYLLLQNILLIISLYPLGLILQAVWNWGGRRGAPWGTEAWGPAVLGHWIQRTSQRLSENGKMRHEPLGRSGSWMAQVENWAGSTHGTNFITAQTWFL